MSEKKVRQILVAQVVVFCASVAFSLLCLAFQGVRAGGDTPLYVGSAEQLLHGDVPKEVVRSRLGFALLIAASRQLGVGLGGVVAVQILVAALSALALCDLGRRLGGNGVGWVAGLMYALNPDIARWHSFILTDSLYISAVPIAVWCVAVAGRGRLALMPGAAVVVLLTVSLRPNGYLFVPITAWYWSGRLLKQRQIRFAVTGLIAVLFLVGVVSVLALYPGLLTNSPETMLRRGEVIWGYPPARLAMPPDPESGPEGILGALNYGLRHPLAVTRLAATRMFTELLHTRPFYSVRHNALLLVLLPPYYLLAVLGFARVRGESLAQLLAVVVAAHLLIQAATYADWDGRFLLYVFPLIGVFSACGVGQIAARCFRRTPPAGEQVT